MLILTFGNIKYDGRLNVIIDSLKDKFSLIVLSNNHLIKNNHKDIFFDSWNSKNIFFQFIAMFNLTIKYIKKVDIIFLDNRKASTLFSFVNFFYRTEKFVIQDMRELYTLHEAYPTYSKIGTFFEHFQAKKSNLVIVCNDHRKRLVKKLLSPKNIVSFENKRALQFTTTNKDINDYSKHNFINFFNGDVIDFNNNKLKFISTGGINLKRGTERIIDAAKKNKNIVLYLVGKSSKSDINEFIHLTKNCKNIFYLGEIPFNKLHSLLHFMNVGIVNYGLDNLNNRYCASGKIYEYLSLGMPVLVTPNKPLLKTISKYNCGISSSDFAEGFNSMILNYLIHNRYYLCYIYFYYFQ